MKKNSYKSKGYESISTDEINNPIVGSYKYEPASDTWVFKEINQIKIC